MAAEHRYPFFTNAECVYFPCHKDVPPDDFNCLFCYCPLYALGPECGGDFRYTEAGRKDCTPCSLPHRGDAGTTLVKQHYEQLAALAALPDAGGNADADAPEGGREGEGPGQSGEGEDVAAGAEAVAAQAPGGGDAR